MLAAMAVCNRKVLALWRMSRLPYKLTVGGWPCLSGLELLRRRRNRHRARRWPLADFMM